jgi:hypothetical protein
MENQDFCFYPLFLKAGGLFFAEKIIQHEGSGPRGHHFRISHLESCRTHRRPTPRRPTTGGPQPGAHNRRPNTGSPHREPTPGDHKRPREGTEDHGRHHTGDNGRQRETTLQLPVRASAPPLPPSRKVIEHTLSLCCLGEPAAPISPYSAFGRIVFDRPHRHRRRLSPTKSASIRIRLALRAPALCVIDWHPNIKIWKSHRQLTSNECPDTFREGVGEATVLPRTARRVFRKSVKDLSSPGAFLPFFAAPNRFPGAFFAYFWQPRPRSPKGGRWPPLGSW